jgi:transposase
MKVKPALALPDGLEVTGTEMIDEVLTITAVSVHMHPCCPRCGTPAERFHSRYTRQITDLPCGGQRVRLLIQVRKCFCDVADCARKIFVERLTSFIEPGARVTVRLCRIVQAIGFATGGWLGARLFELGVDDFAFRRGRKYGTLLVDMQSHQVLDVLPDRSAETVAAWMQAHPEIDLVSRDRGEEYAAAARTGAPQATQVADRFHLARESDRDCRSRPGSVSNRNPSSYSVRREPFASKG